MLLVVAVIHLLPLPGAIGGVRLQALYSIPLGEPNTQLLMRHRAVLFGILGIFFAYAAFSPAHQPAAFVAGFVSIVTFLGFAKSVGGYNQKIRRVMIADVVALVCLALGALARWVL